MIPVFVGTRAMFDYKSISQKPFLDPLCNCILVPMIHDDLPNFSVFLYKQG